MIVEPLLVLKNVHKSYILGNKKNAKLAQREIVQLQKKIAREVKSTDKKQAERDEARLKKAQEQFVSEKYEASYKTITGHSLKKRPQDRGAVVHALRGVNLTIRQGELIAIMGPSGSGKSTMLNILGLLDESSSGDLILRERNITQIHRRELPKIRSTQLGFVFQSFNLITTMTALENVMLPLRYTGIRLAERRAMARAALAKVGLENRVDHTPNELSGGQQQRVAIARSIVNKPAIILGDELTGDLDTKMTKEVMTLIQALNEAGQTIVIVTHNPDVAKQCRRIIHMRDGKVEKDTKVR